MRVGIIGMGSIGKRHAANALALGHDVYFVDTRLELLPHFMDVRDLLVYADPRAVLICTPASTHAQVARELLDAGYSGPLFTEKPLALSSDECEVFRSWPSPVTMTGYMFRHHPKAQAIKTLFTSPCSVTCRCDVDMRQWPGSSYASLIWEASHELDLMLWWGAPPLVRANIKHDQARLEFGDGWPWVLHLRDIPGSVYRREWDVVGDECETGVSVWFQSADDVGNDMYRAELAHFLDCVEKQIPTITPFADGIRVVDVCEQALKLAKATT